MVPVQNCLPARGAGRERHLTHASVAGFKSAVSSLRLRTSTCETSRRRRQDVTESFGSLPNNGSIRTYARLCDEYRCARDLAIQTVHVTCGGDIEGDDGHARFVVLAVRGTRLKGWGRGIPILIESGPVASR